MLTRDETNIKISRHENQTDDERSSRPNEKKKARETTYLDVEIFGVVEHGLECLCLEGHIDFDFLDLARFGGFNVGEGGIQCCLGSLERWGRQRTLDGGRHHDVKTTFSRDARTSDGGGTGRGKCKENRERIGDYRQSGR